MASFTGKPGSRLSTYQVHDLIGRGGMGAVYRATDLRTNTPCALKVLHGHLDDDPEFQERFVREAHSASRLTSPYIALLMEYGEADGVRFMAMELVEGQTILEMLADGPLATQEALSLARQVALGLEVAHEKGLVHRDIKPENVRVTPEKRVKLLDFGITRRLGGHTLTAEGAFIGTPAYAAPETFLDKGDERSDLYSLGVTLFYMLAGEPPFIGTSFLELARHHESTPPPLEKLAGQPEAVVTVVARCLEKEPGERYQKASDLIMALETAMREAAAAAKLALEQEETVVQPAPDLPTVVQPAPEPETEVQAKPAGPAQLTIALEAPRAAGRLGASYMLRMENTGESGAVMSVSASDTDGACRFVLPAPTNVPAGGSMRVPIRVAPRRRRWRGAGRQHEFALTATGGDGGGVPPTSASGSFEELPFFSGMVGWMSIGGGAVLGGGAIIGVLLVFLLGGDTEPTLQEYFEEVEQLAQQFDDGFVVLDSRLAADVDSIETEEDAARLFRTFLNELLTLLRASPGQLGNIDAPREIEEEHQALVDANNTSEMTLAGVLAQIDDLTTVDEIVALLAQDDVTTSDIALDEACFDLQAIADENNIRVDLLCTAEDTPSGFAAPTPGPPIAECPLDIAQSQTQGDLLRTYFIDCVFITGFLDGQFVEVGIDFTVLFTGPEGCLTRWRNDLEFQVDTLFIQDVVTEVQFPLSDAGGVAAEDVDPLLCDDPRSGTWYFLVDPLTSNMILFNGDFDVPIGLPPLETLP